jgi:hypothetical protein
MAGGFVGPNNTPPGLTAPPELGTLIEFADPAAMRLLVAMLGNPNVDPTALEVGHGLELCTKAKAMALALRRDG